MIDKAAERELVRQIDILTKEYHEAVRPFIEQLAMLRAMEPLAPIQVEMTEDQRRRFFDKLPKGLADDK